MRRAGGRVAGLMDGARRSLLKGAQRQEDPAVTRAAGAYVARVREVTCVGVHALAFIMMTRIPNIHIFLQSHAH